VPPPAASTRVTLDLLADDGTILAHGQATAPLAVP